jgi:hypothetical protein
VASQGTQDTVVVESVDIVVILVSPDFLENQDTVDSVDYLVILVFVVSVVIQDFPGQIPD